MHQIEKISNQADIPFDLLLLADETMEAIERYIHNSDCYVVKSTDSAVPIAVFVLQSLNAGEIELKNIAVTNALQGRGIGSWLITEIRRVAKAQGYDTLWVGTPDVAEREITFYEKNGFYKNGLKVNFYIDNYPKPIFDNGQQLTHMVMLKLEI